MTPRCTRRDVMKGVPAGTAAAAGLSGTAAAQSGLSSWFENVSNYDGVVDETGKSEVTVEVGTKGNNGNFAFGPAAVRVDPGTKVVWKWTGNGGSHNVAAEDGSFKSEMTDKKGHTFSQTFEETGVVKYACVPHKAMGMKGAIVVGSEAASGAASGGFSLSADEYAVGGSVLLGLLSPIAFALVLFGRDPDRDLRGR
ncbi:halocyanin domain-containing protein [Halorussus sp. MSC15.2]|uniref:halocyanin domain-containing protein n=1 Tax=Halorussus sp. MSC15.2 TaxID=2283638 RepID=UPI0013D35CC9|nr:halocyanin domain-containing protein [Halorussus sp. MSC15.2]NEU58197.1 halocyanin domain-containing protein [Halorussus sp. MSC15.2]